MKEYNTIKLHSNTAWRNPVINFFDKISDGLFWAEDQENFNVNQYIEKEIGLKL